MKYIPVPCPLCEGLVDRKEIRCVNCGVGWSSVLRMCGEGVSTTQEQIYRFTNQGDWILEKATQNIQTTIDLFTLAASYYRQMEIELR